MTAVARRASFRAAEGETLPVRAACAQATGETFPGQPLPGTPTLPDPMPPDPIPPNPVPPGPASPVQASPVQAVTRMFAEAVRRACRQPHGRAVLVLHLSRMAPPAPRPHHRRIARAMLQDAAQRHEGQAFALENGDLALIARTDGLARSPGPPAPGKGRSDPVGPSVSVGPSDLAPGGTLADLLARLLSVDAPDPDGLVSVWPLENDPGAVLRYVQGLLRADATAPPAANHPGPAHSGRPDRPGTMTGPGGAMHALERLIASGGIDDALQRQTAVAFRSAPAHADAPEHANASGHVPAPGHADEWAGRAALRPIFRQLGVCVPALESRLGCGSGVSGDPFLMRHFAGRLEPRVLARLRGALGSGGPLDALAGRAGRGADPPLHLSLTLDGVNSPDFHRIATSCRDAGVALGIEIALIEAWADVAAFAAARTAVRAVEAILVIAGVSHLALQLASPIPLDADYLKLDWSPRMADLPEADAVPLRAALARIGVRRVILDRAETESAVSWGLSHGIRRFQGRHIDAMLGASRVTACPRSQVCTLRQCIERASASVPAGRTGCGNLPLLDAAAAPPPTEARLPARFEGATRRPLAGVSP